MLGEYTGLARSFPKKSLQVTFVSLFSEALIIDLIYSVPYMRTFGNIDILSYFNSIVSN